MEIIDAIVKNDIQKLASLVEVTVSDVQINYKDTLGRSPLHYAVSSGSVKYVETLLKNVITCLMTA